MGPRVLELSPSLSFGTPGVHRSPQGRGLCAHCPHSAGQQDPLCPLVPPVITWRWHWPVPCGAAGVTVSPCPVPGPGQHGPEAGAAVPGVSNHPGGAHGPAGQPQPQAEHGPAPALRHLRWGGLHGDPQGLPCHHPGTPPAITPSSVMSLGCSHCPFSLPAHTVPPGLSLPKGQNTRPVLAQGTPSTALLRCPQNPGETPCLHLPPPSCSGHGSLSGGASVPPLCHCSDGHHRHHQGDV